MLTKKSASVKFFNMIGTKGIKIFSLYAYKASNILPLFGNAMPRRGCGEYDCLRQNIMSIVSSGGLSGRPVFPDRT